MRIALAQLNPTIGDIVGNTRRVVDAVDRATKAGADVVVCPELMLLGYPPRDLLLRSGVVEACEAALPTIAAATRGVTLLVGHPRRSAAGVRGIANSVSACRDGAVIATYDKRLLPGYDVFDEDRYFDPGVLPLVVETAAGRVGVLVCEDLWRGTDVTARPRYAIDPVAETVALGADVLVSLNASPFVLGKLAEHWRRASAIAVEHGLPVVCVNQVGGQDDLVFDGRSFVAWPDGAARRCLPGWEEAVDVVDLAAPPPPAPAPDTPAEELFHALVLGLRDYHRKTGHRAALLGLSGGIDSAVTACIAAAALGPDQVTGVMLPSRYTSPASREDAVTLAANLGLRPLDEISIECAHETIRAAVVPSVGASLEGLPDENVQARLRGLLLMTLSNAGGALVLATSNKSELAVGYSTLYGDMCGAVFVLGDVLKTRVYELARWINAHAAALGFDRPPIPDRTITRAPSAELRADQTDQDTLPPYEVLDEIVDRVVDLEQGAEQIAAETGFDPTLVAETIRQIDRAEYKRHQAAIILKVGHRAFGRGRSMPLVLQWTEHDEREAAAPSALATKPQPDVTSTRRA